MTCPLTNDPDVKHEDAKSLMLTLNTHSQLCPHLSTNTFHMNLFLTNVLQDFKDLKKYENVCICEWILGKSDQAASCVPPHIGQGNSVV